MTDQAFDVEKTIREYLPQVIHMSLATSRDNKPRVFEVHFAFDNDLNLYFVSSLTSQHSEDIRQNPFVAGNIVTQHFLNQKVRGVYFEGHAEELQDETKATQALTAYSARFTENPQLVKVAKAEDSARFYKITVSDYYVLDGYVSNPPQKFHLPWKA